MIILSEYTISNIQRLMPPIDYISIIDKYYPEENQLKHILLTHSKMVAQRAVKIGKALKGISVDITFLEEAAMLHDIGIFQCNAPSIQCFGSQPYILHGKIGADILRSEGLAKHARVCERHTGTGITQKAIITQNLPLPLQDFSPETIEEQIICYADKFYSKSHLEKEKTIEEVEKSMAKFGEDCLRKIKEWKEIFEP